MNGSLAIPEGLRRQFDRLEKRLWRFDAIVAACGAVCSLLLSFALIFISDRLWDTPSWVRVIFTGAGLAAFGFFLYRYGRRWIWGDRSFPALASLVQRRYRRLGDRLLGIVELADEHKRPANFSPALCKAAIDQVANEASKVDFQQAVGTKRPRQYFFGLMAAGLLAAVFFVLAPQAGWNALMRWLKPTVNVERYTFVSLDNLPDHLVVAHGEPFDLAVGLSAHSLLHPSEVTAQFEKQTATSAPVSSGVAVLHLAGQTEAIVLTLSAGDVTRQITIDPEYRPELKLLSAHVDLPAYLQYPAYDQKIEGGTLTFLEGSRVTFKGQATRALKAATVTDAGKKQTTLRISNDIFATAPTLLQGPSQWTFSWKDTLGLDAVTPMKVRLQQKQDAPPVVDCRGMAGTIAILESETVHVDIVAEDDYGILDVGVRWQTSSEHSPTPSAPVEHKIGGGDPQSKSVKLQYDFSPQLLHIPEDTTVAFCATATDRFPNRAASLSSMHQIYVLSNEAHARLIQDELEKINSELEELARKQESLLEAAKETRAQDPSKLKDSDTEKQLEDQKNEQKDTADQLQKLAEKTAETMKEAAKNPDLSPTTLQQWAKNAETMNSLAQESMPAAAQTLQSAQNNPDDRAPKLDQATKQEQDVLDKMREMQKDAEKSMEKLMAQNLALRLRKIANSEKSIADNFKKMLPDIIGAKPEQLTADQKQAVQDMAKSEQTSQKESTKLQSEITRMFERTKLDNYGDVSTEMDNDATDDSLTKLTETVQNNVSVQAIQSTTEWGKQFNLWADRLDKKDDSKQDDGQGKSGQGDPDKALEALMHIREQQDETRERTGALENQKAVDKDYNADAQETAKQQLDAQTAVQQLQADPDFPVPAADLGRIAKAMGDAKGLLDKPDTGDPTIAAQTDAINMLDKVIMDQAQKSGKSMSSLMAMMGMKPGNKPGKGYFGGGDTDRQNEQIAGTHTGNASDARHILQANGNASAPLPSEFRDAIENYQRAIEQEKSSQ